MWTNHQRRYSDRQAYANSTRIEGEEPRPGENLDQAWASLQSTYPAEIDWLYRNAERNEFARSVLDQARARKSLSPNQLAAIRKCIAGAGQSGGGKPVPKLFSVLQKHSKFYAGRLLITRKNGQTLCWIIWDERCVGKIEEERFVLFTSKAGADAPAIRDLVTEFEMDPLFAARKYGKLSGICCSCGRDLTNDGSIEAGIGPVCAKKFG